MAAIPIGARYMILSALAFSGMGIFVKLAGQRLPTSELVTARALVTLLVSYAVVRARGIPILGVRRGLLLLRGVFGFCGLVCVFYALTHLPIAEATVIQYLHPLFTTLLAAVLLAERPSARLWQAIAISMGGLMLVARPAVLFGGDTTQLDPFAALVAVGGALFSGLAYVTVRKLNETEAPDVIVFYFPLVALPASLPMVARDGLLPQGWEWGCLLALGLLTQLGQIALTRGMQTEHAGRATSYSYLQIVFATLWGVLFFDEVPHPWTLAGSALIVAGAVLNMRPTARGR